MGDFAGVFARDGAGLNPSIVQRLIDHVPGVGRAKVRHGGSFALAQRAFDRAEASRGAPLPCQLADGSVLVADCQLDEPAELASMLQRSPRSFDADLVAGACERWGERAPERLTGHFAYAHWDERARRLTLARDILGARPLFYVEAGSLLIFATTLQTLLAVPETSREIDELVLAQILTREPDDLEQTLYRSIRRVPPAGTAVFEPGRSLVRRYWTTTDIKPVRFKQDADYVDAARVLFDRAVKARTPPSRRLGVTLSGGLDSSGIAATVAPMLGNERLHAFHRAPGAPHPYNTLDERALIELMLRRYPNIDLTVVDDARTFQRDIEPELDAALFALPGAASVNTSWFESLMIEAERAGTEVLLTGSAGNVTLTWTGSTRIAHDLATGRWRAALQTIGIGARSKHQSIAKYLAVQMLDAAAPHALQRWARRGKTGSVWTDHSLVSDDFLARIDYAAHACTTGHDLPFRRRAATATEDRVRALQSQVNRDKAAALRRQFKMKGGDPYGFMPLVEFTLAIPNAQFRNGGVDRWLARRVLADRVPQEILSQTRRGRQCPEWYAIMSSRREGMMEAVERIERSPLACRVVDVPRMRGLLENWPKDAEAARNAGEIIHAHALNRALSIAGFLRWYEGGNA